MSEVAYEALRELQPLTEEERLDARDRARQVVIRAYGDKPTPEQFEHRQMSAYPRWFTGLAITMMAIVFISAGLVSFFRLFSAGRNHFMETLAVEYQAVIVGFATFVLAEFLVITAVVLGSIFVKGGFQRMLTWLAIGAGLMIAFTGNWYITQPHDFWGYLETFVPPFAVLTTAVIGERMIMDTLRRRAISKREYEESLQEWKIATADPEKSDRWRMSYANALREQIKDINSRGAGASRRKEIMQQLDRATWKALVWRELQADEWFSDEVPLITLDDARVKRANGANGNNGTHHPNGEAEDPFAAPVLAAPNSTGNGNGVHS